MSQLPISINKKIYNIHCPDSEHKAVLALADYVNDKITTIAPNCKAMSEVALLCMTLLAIADDVTQYRTQVTELKKNVIEHNDITQDETNIHSVIQNTDLQDIIETIKTLTQTLRDEMSHS